MEGEKYIAIKSKYGTYLTANELDYFTCHKKEIGKNEIFKFIRKPGDYRFNLITPYGKYLKIDHYGRIELKAESDVLSFDECTSKDGKKEHRMGGFGGCYLALKPTGIVKTEDTHYPCEDTYLEFVEVEKGAQMDNKIEEPKTFEEALKVIEALKKELKAIEMVNEPKSLEEALKVNKQLKEKIEAIEKFLNDSGKSQKIEEPKSLEEALKVIEQLKKEKEEASKIFDEAGSSQKIEEPKSLEEALKVIEPLKKEIEAGIKSLTDTGRNQNIEESRKRWREDEERRDYMANLNY